MTLEPTVGLGCAEELDIPRAPVPQKHRLALRQREFAGTHLAPHEVLEPVLEVGIPGCRVIALDPEILCDIGAPDFQRNAVIHFGMGRALAPSIAAIDLRFQLPRRMPDGLGCSPSRRSSAGWSPA